MKKKIFLTSLLALMAFGLAGCDTTSSTTTSTSPTEQSSSTSSGNDSTSTVTEEHSFEIRPSAPAEKYMVNQSVTLLAYLDDAPLLPNELAKVTFASENSDLVSISSNVVVLLASGEATITATYTYEGTTLTDDWTVTIDASDTMTIADAKKQAAGTMVTVTGQVTAVSGSSAYIADATGGLYIYNWSTNADDTAIESKTWTLGESVEVKAKIDEYNGLIQLSNYEGARIDGTYAYKLSNSIPAMTPINLSESLYKDLKAEDAGNLYRFEATYVSGTPSMGSAVDTKWKLGNTEITLRTDKYDKVEIEANLIAGNKYTITTPLSWYKDNPQFAFLGIGTIIEDNNGFVVTYEGRARVGETITLNATYNGTVLTDVTYTITEGEDLGTLDGSKLTLTGTGSMTIHADDGQGHTYDLKLSILSSLEPTTIAEAKESNVQDGAETTEEYMINAKVVAVGYDGVLIGDDAGKENKMYAFFGTNNTSWRNDLTVGTYVSFIDHLKGRYGNAQLDTPEYEVLSETGPAFEDVAEEWTDAELAEWAKTGAIGDYVSMKGVEVVKDGNYTNFTLGSFAKGSIKTGPGIYLDAGFYDLTGYMIDVNGGGYATLLVEDYEAAVEPISVSLNETNVNIDFSGEKTYQLTATVNGGNVTDDSVTWAVTSGEDVVSVSDAGLVTALKLGTAEVTATSVEDPTKSATATINVNDGEVISIEFDSGFNSGFTSLTPDKWEKTVDGVQLTLLRNKGNDIAIDGSALKYIDPLRVYQKHTLTIAAPEGKNISKIVTDSPAPYDETDDKGFKAANVSSSAGTVGDDSITLDESVHELTLTALNQFRLYSITIVLK